MRAQVAVVVAALLAAACSASTSGHGAALPSTSANTPSTPPTSAAPTTTGPTVHTSRTTPPAHDVRVRDVTFVGDQAWALGNGVLGHSTDGGLSWSLLGAAPPHVRHLRFATNDIGYAFSGSVLYLTTDGGHSWQRQPGGAEALETLDGNVIRIVDQGGCPPGCSYTVQLAPIGGTSWRSVSLPGSQGPGDGVQLVRTSGVSALEIYGNPAGGAEDEKATLFTSTDDGASWVRRGEPCPQDGSTEVDSSALTSAPDGSLAVLCTPRATNGWQFIATSTDSGAAFHTGYRRALGGAGISALGAASASVVLVSSDLTYRSADGGRHFAKVAGPARWIGFATQTAGHAISADGRSIWTTSDAGQSWHVATLR